MLKGGLLDNSAECNISLLVLLSQISVHKMGLWNICVKLCTGQPQNLTQRHPNELWVICYIVLQNFCQEGCLLCLGSLHTPACHMPVAECSSVPLHQQTFATDDLNLLRQLAAPVRAL